MELTQLASKIKVGDFIAVNTDGSLVRVTELPARDVFSQCYYYVNVKTADGTVHEFKDIEGVHGWFW
jgi:ASC-1-like (ASCH) protein